MPAKADRVPPDGQGRKAGPFGDLVARQGGNPWTQTEIGLLQGHDIGAKGGDPVQHAPGIAAQVGAKTGADIPRSQAQDGL